MILLFFFSSRRRHTRFDCDWSSDVCSSDLEKVAQAVKAVASIPGITQEQADVLVHRGFLSLESLLQAEASDLAEFPEIGRSEERRVGKECRSRWSPYH